VGELVEDETAGLRASAASRSNSSFALAAVIELLARRISRPSRQAAGVVRTVGLHRADHDVDVLAHEIARHLQHAVGLADAGREAEKDASFARRSRSASAVTPLEQCIGIGRRSSDSSGISLAPGPSVTTAPVERKVQSAAR
jgi:hypothetical protein